MLAAYGKEGRARLLIREVGAGLKEENPAMFVLGQASGNHAAARSSAHDDGVVVFHPSPFDARG
jgi:hypothetical protein